LSVIVVGGRGIASTEVLDDLAGSRRFGPTLPASIYKSSLVMHPKGGVILVGGARGGEYTLTNLILWLRDAGFNSTREKLYKTLQIAKMSHIAFLVPAEITKCIIA